MGLARKQRPPRLVECIEDKRKSWEESTNRLLINQRAGHVAGAVENRHNYYLDRMYNFHEYDFAERLQREIISMERNKEAGIL